MRLVADIKIGRRSILHYVLNPLTRVIRRRDRRTSKTSSALVSFDAALH
jgi:hypothetical protein